MVLVTSNKQQRLLFLNYVQRVGPAELETARGEITALLADLPPGVRLLADLSQLEFMDSECAVELGRTMDLLNQHGVSLIVRVIPDASKDIGLNILTIFHYPHQPRIINSRNLAEALHQLSLWP
jgi:hypothetical protein